MYELRDIYEEMILDHNRNPRNFGKPERHTHSAYGYNPICQDEFTVYLDVKDGIIEDLRFEGVGCAISTAAASLMTQALKGKAKSEALLIFEAMHESLTGQGDDKLKRVAPPKLKILQGVRDYPDRIKCAILAWHVLKAALEGEKNTINTEGEHVCGIDEH
ncbi:MAG: SUF system NifU family Fe-S cluster assembly protein [Gammaproteobacteria bacterium]|nr:SUF system NifU family Fe-S cluster assembly protein [Gammaproteobacteria bacterium]